MFVRDSALLAVLSAALVSCSASADKAAPASAGGFGAGGAAGSAGGTEPVPATLVFSPADPLTLAPRAEQALTVLASPPAAYTVHFALIGSTSDFGAGDGSLDASTKITDSSGRATVTLVAPSMPMIFNVRASVGPELQTLLGVTVNGTDLTTLSVLHSYVGRRKITEFTASIWESIDCSALSGPLPPDGADLTTKSADMPLVLSNVPVGKNLAIALRAGHYVGGCANVAPLSEGSGHEVLVFASDRPLNLEQTTLNVVFGFGNPSADFDALLQSSLEQALAALGAGQNDDPAALLDALASATPSISRAAFSAARASGGWDAALASAYGSGAATRLRDAARPWLNAGIQRFEQSDTFVGTLSPSSASSAQLALTTVAGLTPADAGFTLGASSSWSVDWAADANDNLLLGTELGWVPSRLLTALAREPALAAYPTAASSADALAQVADCALVASVAVGNGATPGVAAYAGCDAACIEQTCAQAATALWQAASDASGSDSATLTVTVTGASEVGDEANVVRVDGSWVGKLALGASSVSSDGPFSGVAP